MNMKSMQFSVDSKIEYLSTEYKFLTIRKVLSSSGICNNNYGEYHVMLHDGSDPNNAVIFLRSRLPGCEVGLIDPSGVLNLEYSIYIIRKDDLDVEKVIEEIDIELQNQNQKGVDDE